MELARNLALATALSLAAISANAAVVCANNVVSSSAADVGITASSDGSLHMFYALDGNGSLVRRYGDPFFPNGLTFHNPGGHIASEPSAASWGPGHIITTQRGNNGALWYLQWNNGVGTDWRSLGGEVTWNPDIVATAPGKLTVFYRGGNRELYYLDYNAGTWTTHIGLGGVLTSSPSAVSWGPDHVAVFKRGQSNDLWYRQRIGSTWTPWISLGGNFSVDPVAVSSGPGQIDVFVRSAGNTISRIAYRGNAWGSWQSLGAPPAIFDGISEPGAAATTSGSVTVFARGMVLKGHNGNPDTVAVYRRTTTDSGSSWSNWEIVHAATGFNLGAIKTNPEATAVSHTHWTVAAPTGVASVPMALCTGP